MQQIDQKKSLNALENKNNRIYQLWSMQSQIIEKLQKEKINKKSIILIGDSNVGKTTLLYYLSGMKLNIVQNKAKKTKQIQPQQVYLNAKVSNSQSTTYIPNIFSSQFTQISLIGMPGLNDKRFMNVLSNMFTFNQVFEKLTKMTKIHIAFVISQQIFGSQQIKQNLHQFVHRFSVEIIKKSNSLSIIFTKTQQDQQQIKEQFIEFIEEIKQELQQDQKQIAQLIDLIKNLNQNERIMFIFPKQDPIKEAGLEITHLILQRDAFIDIDHTILHDLFIDNVIASQKQKISSFQDNFVEVIQQSYFQISQFIDFLIRFTKLLHKNLAPQLFESEISFKQELSNFYATFEFFFVQFKSFLNSEDLISLNEFQNIMSFICENITENKQVCLLDKIIKDLFTKNFINQQKSPQQSLQTHLSIQISIELKNCYNKIANILQNLKESKKFQSLVKGIINFLTWLSQKWYSQLTTVKSLERIDKLFIKSQQQFNKLIAEKWVTICEQKTFSDVLQKFSKIAQQQLSQEQDESDNEQIVKVQDNGYYGNSIKQLKKRYLKVNDLPKLDEQKDQINQILQQQKQLQQEIRLFVQRLQKEVILQVKRAQQSGQYRINLSKQRIGFILFQMRKLVHRIFLQSAMKHFGFYLKFIYYSLTSQREKKELMMILRGFVENLCIVLDQYSLFEEEILLMLFVCGYEKAVKIMQRGMKTGRISQNFVKNQLIGHLKALIQNTQSTKQLEQFQVVVTTAYGYLISEHSSSRVQSLQYIEQMNLMLNQIQGKKVNSKQSTVNSNKGNETNFNDQKSPFIETELKKNKTQLQQQPNYFILINNPYFQFQTVAFKIDVLQKRNTQFQTYQIFYHFHKSNLNNQKLIKVNSQNQTQAQSLRSK